MASVRQGTLARAREWWQHLRPFGKRRFWKEERRAQAAAIDAELDSGYPSYLCGCGCGCAPDQCRQLTDAEGGE